jgi:hypothetical protein
VLYQLSYSRNYFRPRPEPVRPPAAQLRLPTKPHRDGGERDRTADLLNAIQALSQLSYAPGRDTLANGNPEGPASEGVRNAQSSRV